MSGAATVNGNHGASQQDDVPLWQFVKQSEFRLPSPVLDVRSIQLGLRGFVRGLLGNRRESESPLEAGADLLALDDARLARLVPSPEWSAVAQALSDHLQPWIEQQNTHKPVLFLVGAPYGGRLETLQALAQSDPFLHVRAPDWRAIVGCDHRWFKSWPRGTGVWVLTQLEKTCLRRPDGLDLVRELLARALSGELGRGIIGCDSWAWAFLRHVWAGRPAFSETVQAFDHARLARLLAPPDEQHRRHHFRQADNGVFVLSPPRSADSLRSSTGFLERLAAYSRGNPGVAAAIWRTALQLLPETGVEPAISETDRRKLDTVWVKPWERVVRPELPADAGMMEAVTLHALLLHDGLPVARLAEMLPRARAQISETLLYLAEAGLVRHCEDDSWRVTAIGYPVVRSFLRVNDYLIDQL
ncbi:MAG: MarR family transcriptional regulator [Spirochaetaceae bacterium]|nr:MAG: MarR family transcriptional regulator [Spirochaetaceae bacterium]